MSDNAGDTLSGSTLMDRFSRAILCFYSISQIICCYSMLPASLLQSKQVTFVLLFSECVSAAGMLCILLCRRVVLGRGSAAIVVVSVAAFILSWSRCGDARLFLNLLALLVASETEKNACLKALAFSSLATISLIIILSLVGVAANVDVIPNGRLVFAFGFNHPNTFAGLLLCTMCALLYVYWSDSRWVFICCANGLMALFSFVALSSNAAAILFAFIGFVSVIGHVFNSFESSSVLRIAIRVWVAVLPLALMAMMAFFATSYDQTNITLGRINELLHWRPAFAHEYLVRHGGLSMFGDTYQHLSNIHSGVRFNGVDSGYLYLIFVFGLASSFCYSLIYEVAAIRWKSNETMIAIWVICTCLSAYLLVEGYVLYFGANVALLLLSDAFRRREAL